MLVSAGLFDDIESNRESEVDADIFVVVDDVMEVLETDEVNFVVADIKKVDAESVVVVASFFFMRLFFMKCG